MSAIVETDVAIIGAGPVGLFAVFECGMLRMKSVVLDALDVAGGQCAALYPEKPIFDIPAHPAIDAAELIAQLEKQVAPFAPLMMLGRRVETLAREGDFFLLGTSVGDSVRCKAVIIAAGAGAFGPNRPPLEGLEGYEKSGAVRYLVARREDGAPLSRCLEYLFREQEECGAWFGPGGIEFDSFTGICLHGRYGLLIIRTKMRRIEM